MKKRILVLGGGFAGLRFAKKLSGSENFDVTLIDRLNYHQFQPLMYQVAASGIEPSSISFPIRKALKKMANIRFRYCEVLEVMPHKNEVLTDNGVYPYDKLVIAAGATTNFFGNTELSKNCLTMKSVPESLFLRNRLIENFEKAAASADDSVRDPYLNIVVVGGGATGVELAGALAEMKTHVLQKDYPELDFSRMNVSLLEAGDRLLSSFSEYSSGKALEYLRKLGVKVSLNSAVKSYDGESLNVNGESLRTKCVIWVAGVTGNPLKGVEAGKNGRILTDEFFRATTDIYAIGDTALVHDPKYPKGHPQVAPAAMQQADRLADNLILESEGKAPLPFKYRDKGSMATVGRNLAVVELKGIKFGGFLAWLAWMFVHLMSILGIKNRTWIFFGWLWAYVTYDSSLRLVIKQQQSQKTKNCDDNLT